MPLYTGSFLALVGAIALALVLLRRGRERRSLYSKVRSQRERKAEVIQRITAASGDWRPSTVPPAQVSLPGSYARSPQDMVMIPRRRHQIETALSYVAVVVSLVALILGFLLLYGSHHA